MNSFFTSLKVTLVLVLLSACAPANPLEKIMASEDPGIQNIVKALDKHRVQIAYTQIDTGSIGTPQFKTWTYGLDEGRYFYPASTAKLPIVLLTLEKIKSLQRQGVDITTTTPFHIIDPKTGHYITQKDSTHPDGVLTIAHLIKKIFLVSDNDAYNYLFDFLGTDAINEDLANKGLKNTQIHHKFLFGADNQSTWEYAFLKDKDTVYHQTALQSSFDRTNQGLKDVQTGIGYMDKGQRIDQPMDFSKKNRISILDLQGIVQRVIFPELFAPEERFDLHPADYAFVRYWMSRHTLESEAPKYTEADGYYDSYVKFLIYGDTPGKMDGQIRIYNKVGDAYGTLTDTAYIVSEQEGIAFLLTATVFVNDNQIFNDDNYEYDTLGFPFLGALGRAVLAYEREKATSF